MAYDGSFAGGVFVGAGDLDGDGLADIITGAGLGGSPHVKAFRGTDLALLQSFFADDASFTGGVRVGVGAVAGGAAILTGAGPGGGAAVRAFASADLGLLLDFTAFDGFRGGVFVG
jgi:hypothetical protein